MKICKPLQLKADYTIAELVNASAHSWPAKTMIRMLRANGVEFTYTGAKKKHIRVPLSELQLKAPLIWNSIVEVDRIRNKLFELEGTFVRR